jgi:hypothetical protein
MVSSQSAFWPVFFIWFLPNNIEKLRTTNLDRQTYFRVSMKIKVPGPSHIGNGVTPCRFSPVFAMTLHYHFRNQDAPLRLIFTLPLQ